MNHSDIAALMKGVAPVIRDLIAAAVKPLVDENSELRRQLDEVKATVAEAVRAGVAEAVAALPKAENGKDADPELIRSMVAEAVAALPPAKDGTSVDPDAVEAMVAEKVAAAVSAIPSPRDGSDADPALVEQLVTETVGRVVGAWERPADGKSVTLDDVAPLIEKAVGEAVALIPAPKDGAPGKLPLVREWTDEVHHEGDVVTHDGATYQAMRDTGKSPPHADWQCIAAAGRAGKDADEIEVKATFDPDKPYKRLNIVALNGAAFIARKDDPGPCPGEGWQVIAMRGKPGQPGEAKKGDPGKSIKGDAGPPVVAMHVDEEGLLTLVNGDGSTVECDLYPVLAKVMN